MFENPTTGREARNSITKVPKILDLKSSSLQIYFFQNWRWVPCYKETKIIASLYLKTQYWPLGIARVFLFWFSRGD